MAVRRDPRPTDELRYYELDRRVRGERDGEVIVDSDAPLLVWPPGRPVAVYAFPREDVRDTTAATRYDDPDLGGYVSVPWDAADRWLEEDEEVFVHPRDPFHRVEVRQSSRHVVATLDGAVLADSQRPLLLFETGLPTRYYLPPDDVDFGLLEPSPTVTRCPYKGTARHWSASGGQPRDVCWSYEGPLPEIARIDGLISFYNERVDITVDGSALVRPVTPFSRPSR
jgi:uncharacterized protein (DUF427 family)